MNTELLIGAEKQTIFNEAEIARQLNQINDEAKQLLIPMFGYVYLRVESDEEEN